MLYRGRHWDTFTVPATDTKRETTQMNTQREDDQLWGAVIAALEVATGQPADSDDHGMRGASAYDLLAWVGDLEARVGLCVDTMRDAMYSLLEWRETERAACVLMAAGVDCNEWQEPDPRGAYLTGAEVLRGGEYVGIYVDVDGRWYVVRTGDGDSHESSVDDGAGKLDEALAVATLRELLAEVSK